MSEEKSEEKKVLSLDELLGSAEEKTKSVYIAELGGSVVLNKLTIGDLAKVNAFNKSKGWQDDDMRSTIGIIQRGVKEPQMQYSQVESLDLKKATAIVTAIMDFAGLSEEQAETVRNLSERTMEST